MSEMNVKEQIQSLLPSLFSEMESQIEWDLIEKYLEFLKRENERGGFFSKNDTVKIVERHLVDCLVYVWKLKTEGYVSRETYVADVGTGPGLPGFFFLVLKDRPHLYLIDSQKRKLALLEEEVRKGSLQSVSKYVEFLYERVEEIEGEFDLVTSRAMVPYPFIAEVCTNIIKQKAVLCPFMAQSYLDIEKEKLVLSNNGMHLKKEIQIPELDFVGKRHIKILQKNSLPKRGFPREWKEIVKESKNKNG
ncbi:class I SAM-dependent methyltransferase [Leptospira sp. 96542]|nr:class I SAM-dependent methyltransferase [Leptospira sp. 96542]